jgi:hypothetical protein
VHHEAGRTRKPVGAELALGIAAYFRSEITARIGNRLTRLRTWSKRAGHINHRLLVPFGGTKTLTDLSFALSQTVCYRDTGAMTFRRSYGTFITVGADATMSSSNRQSKLLEIAVTQGKQTTKIISNRRKIGPLRNYVLAGSHDGSGPRKAL